MRRLQRVQLRLYKADCRRWRHHAFVKLYSENLYYPVHAEINEVQGFQMGDQMAVNRANPYQVQRVQMGDQMVINQANPYQRTQVETP